MGFTYRATTSPPEDPDRAGRLAREAFTAVLRFYSEAEHPVPRANALSDLARLWHTRQVGDKEANLHVAIGHFEEALRLRDAAGAPNHAWAWTQIGLGHCHRDLPASGDAYTQNLVCAIDHYAAGLRVFLRAGTARDCAMTHNLLGRAYHSLAAAGFEAEDGSSGREQHWRFAIAAYRAALEVYQEQGRDALVWATIQCNLALCFSSLETGQRRENLERARACFEAALRVRTRRKHPLEWADTHRSMGAMCLRRRGWDRGEDCAQAADCFRKALTVYRRSTHPQVWAALQTQLGQAYVGQSALGKNRKNFLRQAARRFRAALGGLDRDEHRLPWAWAHYQLAGACRALAELASHRQSAVPLRRETVASYRSALAVYTAEEYPAMHAGLTRDLATAAQVCGSEGAGHGGEQKRADHRVAPGPTTIPRDAARRS